MIRFKSNSHLRVGMSKPLSGLCPMQWWCQLIRLILFWPRISSCWEAPLILEGAIKENSGFFLQLFFLQEIVLKIFVFFKKKKKMYSFYTLLFFSLDRIVTKNQAANVSQSILLLFQFKQHHSLASSLFKLKQKQKVSTDICRLVFGF